MRKLLLLLFIACATPQMRQFDQHEVVERRRELAWQAANGRHTIFAYRRYLEEFPDSPHEVEARKLLEGLRWAEADRDGGEAALSGYLADEPRGAHAAEAWSRLSALRLSRVLAAPSPAALREWLDENGEGAAGRDRALAALDEADWRAAAEPADLRAYLAVHLGGAHRAEAQARLRRADRDEALALEDEPRLRALDAAAADRLGYDKALALLDEGRLAALARKAGPFAADAQRDLAGLRRDSRRAGELETAARALYLPRPTLDELPEDEPGRVRRLRQWALSLDGARLHRMLGEFGSQRAAVALAAAEGAQAILSGLPAAEAKARAERELASLQPLAVDAPQLAAVAVLQLALRRPDDALSSARRAAGRDPRCAPAVRLAARLEREPGLVVAAQEAVKQHALWLLDAHGGPARSGDAAALAELCAAREEAPAELAIQRLLEEAKADCAAPAPEDRRAAARALAAARSPLARAALARAAARDPDPDVRAVAQGALASAVR